MADLRFAKPLDIEMIKKLASETGKVLTVEENILRGGVGEAIAALLPRSIEVDILAIDDEFPDFGTQAEIRKELGLDAEGIATRAKQLITSSKT